MSKVYIAYVYVGPTFSRSYVYVYIFECEYVCVFVCMCVYLYTYKYVCVCCVQIIGSFIIVFLRRNVTIFVFNNI